MTGARKQWRSREDTARRLLIWIALYAIPVGMVVRPVTDPDIWWHLRSGQWILEHHTVPTTDPFSIYGQNRPWVAYSWLFDVLVYGLYEWLGLAGIVLYRAVLSFGIVLSVHRLVFRRLPGFLAGTGLVGLAVFALLPLLMHERPWLFTILFYAWTLDAVIGLREGTSGKAVWLLPLSYALWTNLHIQFVYGLFLLGLACVAPWLDRLVGWSDSATHTHAMGAASERKLWGISAACLAATLLNPYHIRLHGVVFEYAMQSVPYQLIAEFEAIRFRALWDYAVLTLTIVAAFVLGRRARLSSFEMLLLGSSVFISFRSQRDLWLVVLTALPLIAAACDSIVEVPFVMTPLRAFIVAGAVLAALGLVGWQRDINQGHLADEVAAAFPAGAAAIIEQRGYAGPLFNHFDWGGYLIWRLPQLPVSIDGRTNLHGDERIQRSWNTWAGNRGWDQDPELRAARLVIARSQAPLASLLRLDPKFELVYEDAVAVVFVAQPGG